MSISILKVSFYVYSAVVTCDPPPLIADGTFSPEKTSYQYGDVVEYSCHKGFRLSGTKTMSCSVDGTFGLAPPTCNSKCFYIHKNLKIVNSDTFKSIACAVIDY